MDTRTHVLEHRYATVPFPLGHEVFSRAAQKFLNFLSLSAEIKRGLHFKADAHRSSAEGYTDKRTAKGKDPKEFFHWRPRLKSEPVYQELSKNPVVHDFFTAAERIYDCAEAVSRDVLREHFPELYVRTFRDERLVRGFLRFLCYTPIRLARDRVVRSVEGDYIYQIGAGHYDKCPGTLALAESAPGLRIGCCREHPLVRVKHREHEALFMPGKVAYEYSNQVIIPAWHDVWHQVNAPHISAHCSRWAIVFFIDDMNGYYPEWDEVHTPLRVH